MMVLAMGTVGLAGCSSSADETPGASDASGGGGTGGTAGPGGGGVSAGGGGSAGQNAAAAGAGGVAGTGGTAGTGAVGGAPASAGAGGGAAAGAGGGGGTSNCAVSGHNPNSMLGKAMMEGAGSTDERYHTAFVSRNGDPYVLITNGWGPGFEKHSISWSGTSFTVESMSGRAGAMGQPASYPSVFCGRYSVREVPDCGLPLRRDAITSLKTGWRWSPNCNEGEYNAAYDIWVGNGTQLQGYLMVWLRDPPGFQPAGLLNKSHLAVTVANVPGTWNIWDGTVNGLPIINWVRNAGDESYEIEFDVMDFIRDAEMRGFNVPGTHINAVAVGFEIWEGPITDLKSDDFYVQVN